MSASRTAVRMCAVRALTGATLAGDRVSDSTIEPIDTAVTETKLPMITVTTDDDRTEPINGRDISGAERHLELVVEIAVATKVEVEGAVTFEIPETDFGLEWTLDLLEQQVDRALFEDSNAWSRILMKLVPRIFAKTSRRAASAIKGVRYAARQIVYNLDCVGSPVAGAAVDPKMPFGEFLAALEADSGTAAYGTFLRGMIEGTTIAEWKRQMMAIGMTEQSGSKIGLGPEGVVEEATIAGDYLQFTEIVRAARVSLGMNATLTCTAEVVPA